MPPTNYFHNALPPCCSLRVNFKHTSHMKRVSHLCVDPIGVPRCTNFPAESTFKKCFGLMVNGDPDRPVTDEEAHEYMFRAARYEQSVFVRSLSEIQQIISAGLYAHPYSAAGLLAQAAKNAKPFWLERNDPGYDIVVVMETDADGNIKVFTTGARPLRVAVVHADNLGLTPHVHQSTVITDLSEIKL